VNITSKSRYALKIMLDLAGQDEGGTGLTHRADVASRQGIPLEYMDQILGRLREAGLVVSTRGRRGGYQIGRKADAISMLEIFRSVEDAWLPVACLDGHAEGGQSACVAESVCSTRDTWSMISGAIGATLSGILLSDVLARKVPGPLSIPVAVASGAGVLAVQECRAPRRRPSTTAPLPLHQGAKES
jgi:Rrf2 family protein